MSLYHKEPLATLDRGVVKYHLVLTLLILL